MGSLIMAWLTGEGIIIYRTVKTQHAPPLPGSLLISSGIFVLLGILAESDKARFLAQALGWGFDIAAFINLASLGGPATPSNISVVPWPPPIAPNNVLIPTGKYAQSSSSSSSSSTKPPSSSGTIAA